MSIRNKLAFIAVLALASSFARGDGIVNGGTSASGIIAACGAANNQILYDNAGSCAGLAVGTNGQIIIGTTGAAPAFTSLTGDSTLSAAGVMVNTAINGNTVPSGATAHQTLVATAASTGAWKTIPDCTDASGNHINYTQSTDAFSCGTSAGLSVTYQQFTTSANPTYTPNANLLFAIVECVGQGGGGGGAAASATGDSSGGGGGAGSYSRVRLTAAQIGVSKAVTNTAAANGGTSGNNAGGSGNDTSLGTLCVGKGGSGGGGAAANSAGTAGAGGVVGTGDTTFVGNSGHRGFSASIITASGPSGAGGTGPWGGGAPGVDAAAGVVAGIAGTACGSGGGGGQSENSASATTGGAGGNGCVLVTEFNSK